VVVPNLINQRLSAGKATSDIPFQGIRNLHMFYNIALNVQMENDRQIFELVSLLFLIDILFGWLNEVGRACSTFGVDERWKQGFGG